MSISQELLFSDSEDETRDAFSLQMYNEQHYSGVSYLPQLLRHNSPFIQLHTAGNKVTVFCGIGTAATVQESNLTLAVEK